MTSEMRAPNSAGYTHRNVEQTATSGQGLIIWSDSEMTKNDQIKSSAGGGMGGCQSKFWNCPTPGCGQKAGSSPGTGMQKVPEQGQGHWD